MRFIQYLDGDGNQRVGCTSTDAGRVRRLPLLPGDLEPEMETAIPCACTDRRRVRCRCGARRGQGHALACPVVMERWAA